MSLILSRTPFRISYFGGSSDLPSYYCEEQGAVVSVTIDKYVYINVKRKFDDNIRLSYSITENVENVEQIKHDLVREALRYLGLHKGLEITSISDLPSNGTGLGSSGAFLVGLLEALGYYKGKPFLKEELAELACTIELDILRKPIGKQDQYAAAFGGLNYITFDAEGVDVIPISSRAYTVSELQCNTLLLYTNVSRSADSILKTQNARATSNISTIRKMVELAKTFRNQLENNNLSEIGRMLQESWQMKKSLSHNISSSYIDYCYQKGIENGAIGGKIMGSGGGGFLMFYADPDAQKKIIEALPDLRPLKVSFDYEGSNVVYSE